MKSLSDSDPSWISSNPVESRRISATAAIWASSSALSLEKEFAQLFAASLQGRLDDNNELNDSWCHYLHRLAWLSSRQKDSFLAPIFAHALQAKLSSHITETIGGEFEQDNFLDEIIEWKDEFVVPWIRTVLIDDVEVDEWCRWLQTCVLEQFGRCRMTELFDLVADYPDSHPAVVELAPILKRAHLHSDFCTALQSSLCQRLLHPGANTSQIIDVYINTIKVLREIDPSDRLLQQVAEPVRTYLRGRQDTVRCIITSLTDQDADLYQELRRQDAKPLEDYAQDYDEDEEEELDAIQCPTMDWMPPPPISQQRAAFFEASSNNAAASLDILSMLVSIYGSKELFVDEYRVMLADKLLSNVAKDDNHSTDAQVHTLELLKLRFGDASMRHCEIMMKDIDDSKRIVTNIHSTNPECENINASILSHIFWPTISSDATLQHHASIQSALDQFSTEYGQLKNPRRLVWYHSLGSVELELDAIDEQTGTIMTRAITCSPLLATLVSYFEDQSEWTSDELAEKVGISSTLVEKRMQFWVHQNVIVSQKRKKDRVYQVATIENFTMGNDKNTHHHHHDDDDDEHGSSHHNNNNKNAKDELYLSYITGMLKRYKELPLHRIQELLKLFARGSETGAYNQTPRQLSALLQRHVKSGKLECGPTGMYKLVEN